MFSAVLFYYLHDNFRYRKNNQICHSVVLETVWYEICLFFIINSVFCIPYFITLPVIHSIYREMAR